MGKNVGRRVTVAALFIPAFRKEPPVMAGQVDAADASLHARTMLALGVVWGERQQAAALTDMDVALLDGLGELLERSRRLSVLDKQVKCMIVIACRVVERMAWTEIGEHLGMAGSDAEAVYAGAVRRWLDGDLAPWAPRVPGATVAGDFTAGPAAHGSGARCVKGELH